MIDSWQDIENVYFSQKFGLREKYGYFYEVLHRCCTQCTSGQGIVYNDFFSQLEAVCRHTKYRLYDVDRFRWRARRVINDDEQVNETNYYIDIASFLDAYAHFTGTQIPNNIRQDIKKHIDACKTVVEQKKVVLQTHMKFVASMRFVCRRKEKNIIYAVSGQYQRNKQWKIDFSSNDQTQDAADHLKVGMQFNVVSSKVNSDAGVVIPEMIIIEPDYLIDVTAVCSCIKDYGDSPLNYLLRKIAPSPTTKYTILGNITGQFLDDQINNPNITYQESIRKAFKSNLIGISACDDIDASFFNECEHQFDNIRRTVAQLYSDTNFIGAEGNVLLEPSFFCEALGIQGRFDFLQGDYKNLIEMKSGQWDKFHQTAREEHVMQMILYKEILFYNLGISRQSIGGYLLYSKYPMLLEQRTAQAMVHRMMMVRNSIILLEQNLKNGRIKKYLDGLEADDLNTNGVNGKLWTDYEKPEIERIIEPLHTSDRLSMEYFYSFFTFIAREQYLSRVGDGSIDSTRGMSNLWNADLDTKLQNGDIMIDLKFDNISKDNGFIYSEGNEISSVRLLKPTVTGIASPNFRKGDSVILYERNTGADSATTRQVIRCGVESFDNDSITLKLRHPQSNPNIFHINSMYAIEHEYIDSSMRTLYHGLYSFLKTSKRRRELLLCQRKPEIDASVMLKGQYGNAYMTNIVLRAKQAKDYFLLVGPPGTGKTSVALKSMVDEFLIEHNSILLLAYTNRAVDEICKALEGKQYIRVGRELSCDPKYHSHLIENMAGDDIRRTSFVKLIKDMPIVVGTVSAISSSIELFKLKSFDVAIFDEASQILEPQLLPLLCDERNGVPSIRKFVMIGDHKQLPAVVVQGEETSKVKSTILHTIGLFDCRNSLFERLYDYVTAHADAAGSCALLTFQGRMHPDIAQFASSTFYDKALQTLGLEHQKEELPYRVFDNNERFVATTRFGFINVPSPPVLERTPKMNVAEAKQIAQIVVELNNLALKNGMSFDVASEIGIIVPFRRQITAVRSALYSVGIMADDILIDTVERYQGSQKNIIIYGTTISQRYELDLLSNIVVQDGVPVDRKLNVAVTRARKQMFVVGSKSLLSQNPVYKKLIEYAAVKD